MKTLKSITAAAGCAVALFMTGCASTDDSRSTGQVIDDTAIHAKVKTALLNDPVISGTAINVDVERGVVTLAGAVNGTVEKRKAEEVARGVDGVRSVQNKLIVRDQNTGASATVEVDTKDNGKVTVE
jgi:hyperosmotically inducible periplasmic protein